MQHIIINPDNVTAEELGGYARRTAARGVVLDEEGKVGMLHASVEDYIKLAGGGVDEGESIAIAFEREILEELGCRVKDVQELCIVEEWRKEQKLLQISHCFVAHIDGEKGEPSLTDKEIERGFSIQWMSPQEAYDNLSTANKDGKEFLRFMRERDGLILKTYLTMSSMQ